jgi:hypothetical protein
MHKDAARRRFDVVMAWSVDRLGRSLQDLCGFLSELHAPGHRPLFSTSRQRVTNAPFQLGIDEGATAVLAAGLGPSNARVHPLADHGSLELCEHAHHLEHGLAIPAAPGRPGFHKIAKQFGVGSGTVQRIAAAS